MNRNEYNLSVDKFSDDVFRFIYKTCHNKELAEDIIQDAYMVLWEHVGEITFEKAKAFSLYDFLSQNDRYIPAGKEK